MNQRERNLIHDIALAESVAQDIVRQIADEGPSNVVNLRPQIADDKPFDWEWDDEEVATFQSLPVHMLELSIVCVEVERWGTDHAKQIVGNWRSRMMHPCHQPADDCNPHGITRPSA